MTKKSSFATVLVLGAMSGVLALDTSRANIAPEIVDDENGGNVKCDFGKRDASKQGSLANSGSESRNARRANKRAAKKQECKRARKAFRGES